MEDYLVQTVDLYEELAGSAATLRVASTPFVPEGTISVQDLETTGQLAGPARILMKGLWLARLARPDILKPIWHRSSSKHHSSLCVRGKAQRSIS